MEIHRELRSGFLEKVYENALMLLLEKNNIKSKQQQAIKIKYKEKIIGDYIADIIVDDKTILELKSVSKIIGIHKAQLANYLKATEKEVGILLNFGNKSLEIERVVLQKSIESEKSATKKESIEMSSEEVREAKTELIKPFTGLGLLFVAAISTYIGISNWKYEKEDLQIIEGKIIK